MSITCGGGKERGGGGVILGNVVPKVPISPAVSPFPFGGPGPTAEVTEVTRVVEHVCNHCRRHAADTRGRRGVWRHRWWPHDKPGHFRVELNPRQV